MKFKDEDFSRLMFNVHTLPQSKKVIEAFDLSKYKEFEKPTALDKDKVLKYIVYLYDKNTPLLKEADLNKRKALGLELAGFSQNKSGKYSDHDSVVQMISCENEHINKMVLRFVRMQRDLDYAALIAQTQNFFNTIGLLNSNTVYNKDEDKLKDQIAKGALSKMIPDMLDDIKKTSNSLFNGDAQLVYAADEQAQEEAEDIPFAERYARKID